MVKQCVYNTRPRWLETATLDAAVATAYRWTPSIFGDDALKALLELNGPKITVEGMVAR